MAPARTLSVYLSRWRRLNIARILTSQLKRRRLNEHARRKGRFSVRTLLVVHPLPDT